MRFLFAVLASLALFATSLPDARAAGTLEQIRESGKIRIGFREAEPPMSFIGKDGQPVGYSIDLCQRIANGVKNDLGLAELTVEFVPVTAKSRFPALTENRIDILCGSTTKTLTRSKLVDFTQLTFVTGASLLSLQTAPLSGIADLQGKKVAVIGDTTTIDELEKGLWSAMVDAEVVTVATAAEGVNKLRGGEVNAFAADQVVLIGLVLTSGGGQKLAVSTDLFSFEPFALAVRRDDADFRLAANRVISQLYRSGQIGKIYEKWFGVFSKQVPPLLQALYRLNSTPE